MNKGERVEILKAYSQDTHSRSIDDEISGCEAYVLRDEGKTDVLVEIKGTWEETWVNRGRIKTFTGRD